MRIHTVIRNDPNSGAYPQSAFTSEDAAETCFDQLTAADRDRAGQYEIVSVELFDMDPAIRYAGADETAVYNIAATVNAASGGGLPSLYHYLRDGGCPAPTSVNVVREHLDAVSRAAETIIDPQVRAEVDDAVARLTIRLSGRATAR